MHETNKKLKVNTPGSVLLLGPQKSCEEYLESIIAELKPDWADIKIIRPEDSKGKTLITSIEQVKEAQNFVNLTPIGTSKLVIFTDAASMPAPAANALLKTLEDPPKYALIVLQSSTENLLPTIVSRCQVTKLWNGAGERQEVWNFDKILEEPFYTQSQIIAGIAENQEGMMFLTMMEEWARNKLRKDKSKDTTKFIKEIVNAKGDLKHNVATKVVLESLILRYIHHV